MKRKSAIKLFVDAFLIIALIIGFVLINDQIAEASRKSFKFIADSNDYAYQIESITIDESDLTIKGWFFELKSVRNVEKENLSDRDFGIVLYDANSTTEKDTTGKIQKRVGVSMNMRYESRPDINEYYICEHDYSRCGFVAKCEKSGLNLESGIYQLVFKPEEEGETGLETSFFLNKGMLSYVDPKDNIDLDVVGTDLEPIVKEGICVVSCPEAHICVYQKDDKLYWITEEGFKFNMEGRTVIQYQLETTQFDKLPKKRLDDGCYWDNLGFVFENCEITNEIKCGRYRVCMRELPKEYAITRVSTSGYVEGAGSWKGSFRPLLVK